MARIFMDGFEYGKPLYDDARNASRVLNDYNDSLWKFYATGYNLLGASSTAFNGGNYSCYFTRGSSNVTGQANCLYRELGASYDKLFSRFNMKLISGTSKVTSFFSMDVDNIFNATSMQLKVNDFDMTLYLYVNGVSVASVASAFIVNAWHCVEVMYDYTGSNIIVKIDNSEVINYSGALESGISIIGLGRNDTASESYHSYGHYIDDFALNDISGTVNNSWIGSGLIRLMRPISDGANSDFTPSTGIDNYAMVDEIVTDNDTTYNVSTTANDIDTFSFPNVDSVDAAQTINAVQAIFRARSENVATKIAPVMISGVTTDTGTAQQTVLSDYVDMKHEIYNVDPNTSVQWTEANVNAIEAGYKHVTT